MQRRMPPRARVSYTRPPSAGGRRRRRPRAGRRADRRVDGEPVATLISTRPAVFCAARRAADPSAPPAHRLVRPRATRRAMPGVRGPPGAAGHDCRLNAGSRRSPQPYVELAVSWSLDAPRRRRARWVSSWRTPDVTSSCQARAGKTTLTQDRAGLGVRGDVTPAVIARSIPRWGTDPPSCTTPIGSADFTTRPRHSLDEAAPPWRRGDLRSWSPVFSRSASTAPSVTTPPRWTTRPRVARPRRGPRWFTPGTGWTESLGIVEPDPSGGRQPWGAGRQLGTATAPRSSYKAGHRAHPASGHGRRCPVPATPSEVAASRLHPVDAGARCVAQASQPGEVAPLDRRGVALLSPWLVGRSTANRASGTTGSLRNRAAGASATALTRGHHVWRTRAAARRARSRLLTVGRQRPLAGGGNWSAAGSGRWRVQAWTPRQPRRRPPS